MRTAVVLLSGGMDSAVCASIAKKDGYNIYVIHVDYGQRTNKKEFNCAKDILDDSGNWTHFSPATK